MQQLFEQWKRSWKSERWKWWQRARRCMRLVTSVYIWRSRLLVCVKCENSSENEVACLMKAPRRRPHLALLLNHTKHSTFVASQVAIVQPTVNG